MNRHKQAHLPASLQLAREHENVLSAEHLLAEMSELKDRLWRGLEQAETARNPAAFVSFAREFRQCLESYFHISEGIADKARANGKVEIHVVYDTPDGKPFTYPLPCPHCEADGHRTAQIRAMRSALEETEEAARRDIRGELPAGVKPEVRFLMAKGEPAGARDVAVRSGPGPEPKDNEPKPEEESVAVKPRLSRTTPGCPVCESAHVDAVDADLASGFSPRVTSLRRHFALYSINQHFEHFIKKAQGSSDSEALVGIKSPNRLPKII